MSEAGAAKLARRLGALCRRRRAMLAVAESCTGGGLAAAITSISGSSKWFDRGFVTYSNEAKREMLGVAQRLLDAHGAVSEQVARAMARGALRRSAADFSVSITGVAGPTGGSRAKPVGLVWIAWAARSGPVLAIEMRFEGDRDAIRAQSVIKSIQGLIELLR